MGDAVNGMLSTIVSPYSGRRGKPLWEAPILLAVLLLAGCSSVPGSGEPPSWTPGRYRVSGEISYRADARSRPRTERLEVWGDVTVDADGPVTMDASEGSCDDPEPSVLRRQLLRGRRSFLCNGTWFTLQRASNSVKGTIRMSVTESIRVRGPCAQWAAGMGERTDCVRYSYTVRSNRVVKRVSIRVHPLGSP